VVFPKKQTSVKHASICHFVSQFLGNSTYVRDVEVRMCLTSPHIPTRSSTHRYTHRRALDYPTLVFGPESDMHVLRIDKAPLIPGNRVVNYSVLLQ
jgi:hypothetical protein